MTLLIRSFSKVILPVTIISSSVILRRNKKLKKKHRKMLRVLQVTALLVVGYQNLPFFKDLINNCYSSNPLNYSNEFINEILMKRKYLALSPRKILFSIYKVVEFIVTSSI
jgi:hypothetical protein